jgi:hypothetical protein
MYFFVEISFNLEQDLWAVLAKTIKRVLKTNSEFEVEGIRYPEKRTTKLLSKMWIST